MPAIGFDILVKETEGVYLIQLESDNDFKVWLPKSKVKLNEKPTVTSPGEIDVPVWLIKQKDLEHYLVEDIEEEGDYEH